MSKVPGDGSSGSRSAALTRAFMVPMSMISMEASMPTCGELGLEDLGELVAVAAGPDEHGRLERIVRPVAHFGQQRLGLLRVVGR